MQAVPSQKLKVKKSDIFTFFQEESWPIARIGFTHNESVLLVIFEEVSTEFLNFYEFPGKKNEGIFSHF